MSSPNSNQLSISFEAPSLPILISRIQTFLDQLKQDAGILSSESAPTTTPTPVQQDEAEQPKKRGRKPKTVSEATPEPLDTTSSTTLTPTVPSTSSTNPNNDFSMQSASAAPRDLTPPPQKSVANEQTPVEKVQAPKEFTKQDATNALLKLNAAKGMTAAVGVLSQFNASKIGELAVEKYADFVSACETEAAK